MKGFVVNLEQATTENTDYRRVLYTARNCQLVLMAIEPGGEIGEEVHKLDQFIHVEEGEATVELDGVQHVLTGEWAVVIPAGTKHNVSNTGDTLLKLYSVYAPPEHRDGVVHATKNDETEEHFDGTTTE